MDNLAIKTEGLSKRFGKKMAVDDLNLEVCKGSVYGFLGRNGAGKTTAIKMLLGLLQSNSGKISVLNLDPLKKSTEIKRRVGYVAENQKMYDWMTIEEIMGFSGSFYPTWDTNLAEELLRKFELPRKEKLKNLSRGMYGKVALLLALSHNPELLILDDPTSGLDAVVRREFLEGIVEIIREENRTVFFSTHIINEIERVADYIGIVEEGKLLTASSLDDLKSSVKKVRLIFEDKIPEKIEIDGLLQMEKSGHELVLTLKEFQKERLETLRRYSPKSTEVIDLGLEDIFVSLVGKRSEE